MPRTQAQVQFVLILSVANLIAYSSIIGVFIDTLMELRERESLLIEELDDAYLLMEREGLEDRLEDSINLFTNQTFHRLWK